MAKKHNYIDFKVFTLVEKNGEMVEDISFDNMSYKIALGKYKELRISMECEDLPYTILNVVGLTEEGEYITRFQKEFGTKTELLFSEKDIVEDTSLLEDCVEEELDYTKYLNDDALSEDFATIGDALSGLSINFDSIADDSNDDDNDDDDDNFDENSKFVDEIESGILGNKSTNIESFDDLTDGNSNDNTVYVNNSDITSLPQLDIIKNFNIEECHKYLGDISTQDIVSLLISTLRLLEAKHLHSASIMSLLDKKRDCLYHDFEKINSSDFVSSHSEDSCILHLGKQMKALTKERRIAKDEHALSTRTFDLLRKVQHSNLSSIDKLHYEKPVFDENCAPNIKIYSYTYETDSERDALLSSLELEFDKVINVRWGLIECYNNIGSSKAKKKTLQAKRKLKSNNISILDSVSSKKYDSIVNSVVPFGKVFLKAKGSSVKLTNINNKGFKHLSSTISHKYKEVCFDEKSNSAYLIDRVK